MILKNCKLVPELTEANAPVMADVIVKGSLIEAVVPCGSADADGHEVIDLDGATLLPGLIDAHVHLFNGKRSGGFTLGDRDMAPSQWAYDAYAFAKWFLDNGYTTIRDVGDESNYCGIATRNAIQEGIVVGPRVFCSGMTIVPLTAGFNTFEFRCAFYGNKEEIRSQARNQFYHGADFLKLYGTGSMLVEDSMPGRRIMLEDEISEAVAVARLRGSYCAVHCHGAEACDVMVDLGVRTIEHASFISDETCRKLDGRKDAGLVPTISCSLPEAQGITRESGAVYDRFENISAERDACIRNAGENYDILMGWGTDMDIMTMEKTPYIEWKARKDRLGFSNIDLLKQATINSAILMGVDDKIGSIAAGKFADLIVVNGDPVNDITAMYQKPVHVFKDGVMIR